MTVLDLLRLALVAATPTLLGVAIVLAPRWYARISRARSRRRPVAPPEVIGLPIQRLAADLRRLLRLHTDLSASAHIAMRAHRLWAVEAAIGARAMEAARALGVPHPDHPGDLTRDELTALLETLAGAGLVLPAKVGPFTASGRL